LGQGEIEYVLFTTKYSRWILASTGDIAQMMESFGCLEPNKNQKTYSTASLKVLHQGSVLVTIVNLGKVIKEAKHKKGQKA
jgi:hypothetical protein